MKKAYLVFSDGRYFEGIRIGADHDSTGELVFTTGVVGYQETLSDPSFAGQIVLQTFPMIGNYGVIELDHEGGCAARGYVVRELCDAPSNFRCEGDLDSWLKERGVPGIAGVDTREITRILREEGTQNARICSEIPADCSEISAYAVSHPVEYLEERGPKTIPASGEKKYKVALIDYGASAQLISALTERGCDVQILPHDTRAAAVMALAPDGVVLSGGPGDPADNDVCIAEIAKIIGRVPVLGVGVGHQMAALAMGGTTAKLKYGHRGANQPVKAADGSRTYITSQNHGYIVETLPAGGKMAFVNANDSSCEGIEYPGKNCLTVQFTPDGGRGYASAGFVYDRFTGMMEGKSNA